MRNDDQLAHDLGDAFRSATTDLTYSGRVPTPRLSPAVATPVIVAGVAGAVGVAAVIGAASEGHHAAHRRVAAGATVSATPTTSRHPARTRLVTKKLKLAGFTMVYTQAAGDAPLYGRFVSAVPDGATRVQQDGPSQDWVGVDPATGDNTAYVDAPSGEILAITSADATRSELVALLQSAQPTAIPVVGGSDS